MKSKGLLFILLFAFLIGGIHQPCFGQLKQSNDVYKSLFVSYVHPNSYATAIYYEEEFDNIKPGFCFEIGYNYLLRLRNQLYFKTGASLENLNYSGTKKDIYSWSNVGDEQVFKSKYSNTFLKVPFDLCLLVPLNEKAVLYPSIGLSICGDIYSYSNKINDDVVPASNRYKYEDYEEESSGLSVAAIAPQIGVTLLIDKLQLGLRYEMLWSAGESMNTGDNIVFSAGVNF